MWYNTGVFYNTQGRFKTPRRPTTLLERVVTPGRFKTARECFRTRLRRETPPGRRATGRVLYNTCGA